MTKVTLSKDAEGNEIRVVIIEPEPDAACEFCGKVDELRPYGPNFEKICFECAMKDEETTKRMMNLVLFGD